MDEGILSLAGRVTGVPTSRQQLRPDRIVLRLHEAGMALDGLYKNYLRRSAQSSP